ncbi:unnamed protein product [Bursaphelenchus xylophilus]|uniref:NAD(P)H oxidase (H2O2-forming) n=1 Tax=Bursaphelenchus xylophilus TaxID=6326 RepID=A0A1I7SU46_BURXY|nr:unnamed protein product [Bursaphelenchus xylophilus]CAG9107581.1 unnamed protein product [Bursaphelenchus xylophilus]
MKTSINRLLLTTLASLILSANTTTALERVHEYQRYDGWYNNLANPQWGTINSRLHRDAPSSYEDGVYKLWEKDLPSARNISNLVFKGPDGIPNARNLTTMMAFFSQVVAYEIMQSTQISCPLEMHKIPVPKCDTVFDSHCKGETQIPFTRAKYDKTTGHGLNSPREQVNDRTAWIDASFLYSTQEPWVAALRSYVNGTLKEHDVMKGYPPFNNPHIPLINPPPPQIHRLMRPERLFILGDPRVNENPGLLSFGLILFRWHNIQAKDLAEQHADWTDEELFQGARRMVIATLQKIIYYDYLPALLGGEYGNRADYEYTGYKPFLPPGISHSFATTAFRFPHTIVPPGMLFRIKSEKCKFRDEVGGYPALRLCQNWWNAQDIVRGYTVDEIVLGMASQLAEAEDNIVVEDLRDFIFGPMHFTRLDVVSTSIMRARDNGILPYNRLRKVYGLPERTWETINDKMYTEKPEMFAALKNMYHGDINKLDAYVGGMLETDGKGPGELFAVIIKDQFKRLRDGDRFWFENADNGIFTKEEIAAIHNITMKDIIVKTTEIQENYLQDDVFFHTEKDPCPQPFQVNTTNLERCVPFMRFDHFTGNEVTYIYTCIALGCVPLICIGIGYLYIQRRRKLGLLYEPSRRQSNQFNKAMEKSSTFNKGAVKASNYSFPVIEWINETYYRSVLLVIEPKSPSISLEKPRGGVLRRVPLFDSQVILMNIGTKASGSISGPFVAISVRKHNDIVVRFRKVEDFDQFHRSFSSVLATNRITLHGHQVETDVLLEAAETKEKRQHKLDFFFREAYSKAFNVPKLRSKDHEYDAMTTDEVLEMKLSKAEFAEALGMKENDMFVERMYACMKKDSGDDSDDVTFQQMLEVLRKFSSDDLKEKLKLVFNMCDTNQDGKVQAHEFADFVMSLNVAAGVKIDEEEQERVISSVLHRAGIEDRKFLTEKDFEAIFSQTDDQRRPLGMHLRGRHLKVKCDETESLNSFAVTPEGDNGANLGWFSWLSSYLESNRQHVVILFIFFAINAILFTERFWHYRYETEHRDLRRVMGVGIAITRGAAAALSFDMAIVLLTVCRNVLTIIRETPLGEYLPLDSAITFHKIVAISAGVFSAIHTVGHCINFYHVATQSQEGLACLFQEAVFGSNFLPSISYWFFGTLTGITGILLVAIMCVIYVFAMPAVLKRAYHAFRLTHLLNILLYALTILHGLPRLLDSPKFWYYVIGPIIIFIIDKIIGMRQQYKQLQILYADIYPSDIIYIKFHRPHSFKFRSGQWVRVSCPNFSCSFNTNHAFSIASAPQSKFVELYIKAVGPWTWQLRNEISECLTTGDTNYPAINLNGPFGDGNQEWHNYDVCVMVGGGIGVTPYASTLMDLVMETSADKHCNIRCKKVYFLWICPTHKNFEWFVDVLKEVESLDRNNLLEIHVFVTQFFHKFDLRTTMLYICEKHFRGNNRGKSMFTGLSATNHFGRPNFDAFFTFLQKRHQEVNDIGVFSCGPNSINKQIRNACQDANRVRNAPSFVHRFETF